MSFLQKSSDDDVDFLKCSSFEEVLKLNETLRAKWAEKIDKESHSDDDLYDDNKEPAEPSVEKEKQEAETEQQPGTSQKPDTSGETEQVVEEEEKAAIPSKTTRSESDKVNNFIPLCSLFFF
jgi:hypothetical protein